MSWFDGTRARLRLLFARRAAEHRMDEEIGLHIELETDRLVREKGLTPAEARRQALVAFGGVERYREEMRDGRGLAWLTGMKLDLALGWRMLLKYPGLSAVGVVGMAVAVGIGTVTFGIIYTLVGTVVPLDEGSRVVAIHNMDPYGRDIPETHLQDVVTWNRTLRTVDELGTYRTLDRNLIAGDGRPEPVRVAEMSASGFRMARVPPLLGRYFNDEDERAGEAPVVVIGHALWQSRFAGRRDVVGRTLQLGATRHTVIGVMPDGFAFPINNRIWTPLRLNPLEFPRGRAPSVQVFGRLAPGATFEEARAELTGVGRQLAAAHPATHEQLRPRLLPYARAFLEDPQLVWVFHLVQVCITMILVAIGINVAILVYARTATRAGEIAVRTALGASRRRVVAQLFAEAFVLSATAAAIGMAGGWLALQFANGLIGKLGREQVPFWWTFGISPGTLAYVAGMAVLGAVVVGVIPALKATRRDVHLNLQQLGPGGSGMRLGRGWTALVVAQVAVAVAMLPLAIAGMGNWLSVQSVGPGYPAAEFLATPVHLDREGMGTDDRGWEDAAFGARYAALQAELVRRLEAQPEVADVMLATAVPGGEPYLRVEVEGQSAEARAAARAGSEAGLTKVNDVDHDYFAGFGIPLLTGRTFGPGEVAGATETGARRTTTVVVNRSFVEVVLGGGDALGRRIRPIVRPQDGEDGERAPWYEIVGVVADFPHATNLQRRSEPRVYYPLVHDAAHPATVIVHVRGAPAASLADRVRDLTVAVDPMLRLGRVETLDDTFQGEATLDRAIITAMVLVILSVVLLSSAGIYALMSLTVTRRRREIGVRAALGAGARGLVRSVLSRAMGQVAMGIVVGCALAGLMDHALDGGWTGGRGMLALAGVAALMAAVGFLAALGPARRALRISPTEALKTE